MTPRPDDVGSFGEAVYRQLEPLTWADEDVGWHFLIFLGAIGQMFQAWDTLAHDDGDFPAWSMLLDINRIPGAYLPWLGQYIGVRVNAALSEDQQRQQIRDHESWDRGKPSFIIKGVQMFLSGTKTVILDERDTSAYHFTVYTYGDETPADATYQDIYDRYATYENFYTDWATYAQFWGSEESNIISDVIAARKPAGTQFAHVILPGSPGSLGSSYLSVWLSNPTYEDIWNKYQTYEDLYISEEGT